MATKLRLQFDGLEEIMQQLESSETDLKRAVEGALKDSKQYLTPKLRQEMNKHYATGRTDASLDTDMTVKWEGTKAYIDVGYHIRQGGLPSIFFMYGTPRHAPHNQYGAPKRSDAKQIPEIAKDKKLYGVIYGAPAKKELKRIQKEAMEKILRRRGG